MVRRSLAVALWSVLHAFAQFGPVQNPAMTPQAKTAVELDDYFKIVSATNPNIRIGAADEFAKRYANSDLLGMAYSYQMLACEEINDVTGTLRAGRQALVLLPDNLKTLLTLASAIPNTAGAGPETASLLAEAEGYARRALSLIDEFHVPREFSIEDWRRMRGEMLAQAHESLGHIAGKRGDWPGAVAELRKALGADPSPQGSRYFRLGVACAMLSDRSCAEGAFSKAVELGPEGIRVRARKQLGQLTAKTGSK